MSDHVGSTLAMESPTLVSTKGWECEARFRRGLPYLLRGRPRPRARARTQRWCRERSTDDVFGVRRQTISTSEPSYGPGSLVIMASSIRNASNSVCSIAVGPTSPSMTVTSSHGAQVWNGCYVNGHPGACALYLVVQSLEPGAAYTKTVSWDQRSGAAAARVPVGVYELSAQFSGIALDAPPGSTSPQRLHPAWLRSRRQRAVGVTPFATASISTSNFPVRRTTPGAHPSRPGKSCLHARRAPREPSRRRPSSPDQSGAFR